MITDNGSCSTEIRSRIAMAKSAFSRRKELFTRGMSQKVKKQIIKAVVWSVFLYGPERWSLKAEDVCRIEAFEMRVLRRMEKVSWVDTREENK